jgi:dihydroneopterin aldolase
VNDRIELRGLRAIGYHGVLDHERRDGQPFVVDVDLDVDLRAAGRSDDLSATVDYGVLASRMATAVRETRYLLIEALASHLAELALEDPRVTGARVRVAKPEAPVEPDVAEVAVVVYRQRGEVRDS